MIVCIVNNGFSEAVMDAAKAAGARGGTVINARGTADKEAEKFFNISIQPEKEMVLILVKSEIRDTVLHALYKGAAQGIAFAAPVDAVVGLSSEKAEEVS